jgi:hypothetical protein
MRFLNGIDDHNPLKLVPLPFLLELELPVILASTLPSQFLLSRCTVVL